MEEFNDIWLSENINRKVPANGSPLAGMPNNSISLINWINKGIEEGFIKVNNEDGVTNLVYIPSTGQVTNDNGTGFTIPVATMYEKGLLTKEDYTKLYLISVTQPIDLDLLSNVQSDKNYVHNQQISSTTWIAQHNLNKIPSVTVIDTTGRIVYCGVEHINNNTTILNFTNPEAGTVVFN